MRGLHTGLTVIDGEHCGVDFYGDRVQVVMPGSAHPSGGTYQWRDRDVGGPLPDIESVPVFDLDWLPDPPTPAPTPSPTAQGLLEEREAANGSRGHGGRGDLRTLDIVALFKSRGMYRADLGAGKHAIVCPWEGGHSVKSRQVPDTSTVVWEASGEVWPSFRCLHSNHCNDHTIHDVLDWFGPDEVDRHCDETWSPKRAAGGNAEHAAGNGSDHAPWSKGPRDYDDSDDHHDDSAEDKPVVEEVTDLNETVQRALRVLRAAPGVFTRGSGLVRVTRSAPPPPGVKRERGTPSIEVIPDAQIKTLLCRHSQWKKRRKTRNGNLECVPARPSTDVIKAVSSMGTYPGFRPLECIVQAPVLRADGTVLTQPGYDERTGLVLVKTNRRPVAVPEHPTQDDAREAADRILDSLRDFPWTSPETQAAWLAGMLTIPARHAFEGPAPMVIIDANVAGAGKTLLAYIAGLIGTGGAPAVCVPPKDNDELRKRITALAMQGANVVLLDNVTDTLGWPALDGLLTSPDQMWSDRVLTKSEMTKVRFAASWWCTANNADVAFDTMRRALWVRLETQEERPEQRSDIEIEQPAYTRRHLPKMQADALTILVAYCQAGRPDQGLPRWGSFEQWSALVRNAVVWAGQPDPAATRSEIRDSANCEGDALGALLHGWAEVFGIGKPVLTAELLAVLYSDDPDADEDRRMTVAAMREALEEMLPPKAAVPPTAKSLGKAVLRLQRRVVAGRSVVGEQCRTRRRKVWVLRSLTGGE